jgi:hypothetical protein
VYGSQPGAIVNDETSTAHNHKGLLGWRHCVECQRARAKARYGVDVLPPPSFEAGLMMPGQSVVTQPGRCATCEAAAGAAGPVAVANPHVPGYAVVGGAPAGYMVASASTPMAAEAPGYAVVGGNAMMPGAPGYATAAGAPSGNEPAPVGVARSTQPAWANPSMVAAGARPGAGPYDPSVMPSSVPPPQDAIPGPAFSRPHLIRNVLHLPEFGERRRERAEKAREKHAAIAYDQAPAPVTELPASMVYGKNGH